MSEMAKHAREAMKAKAHRMASGGDPHERVDGSSWREAEPLDADAQTGPRPVSKRAFKRGGKVEGEHERKRADRRPRKSGGAMLADALINRNVKDANEERPGTKHTGGMKTGGRAKRADGGSFVPTQRMQFQGGDSQMARAAGLKHGGHADEAEDKALIKREVKKDALKRDARKHGGRADAHWIEGAVKHPGALHRELNVADDKRIPEKKLEKAEHSKNKMVAKRAHLAETLRDMHKKGGGSVDVLRGTSDGGRTARKDGGRTSKGKMNVNIIIAQKPDAGAMPPAGLAPPPQMPPKPPMGAIAPPMGGPPPGAAPPMAMPPGAGPPMGGMPRKRGGRTYEAGSGSGLGRLEKAEEYGHRA